MPCIKLSSGKSVCFGDDNKSTRNQPIPSKKPTTVNISQEVLRTIPQFKDQPQNPGTITATQEKSFNPLDLLDVPQKVMMEALTTEYIKPSQYMANRDLGNDNQRLAADLVLDPLNLLPVAKGITLMKGDKYLTPLKKTYNSIRNYGMKADNIEDIILGTNFQNPTYALGGETDNSSEWMGNKLDKQGFVTSTTKGGNRISFTGNARSDDWINKQLDTGNFGYNPKTGTVVKLDNSVQGLSKEDKIRGTESYAKATLTGFPSKEQQKEISKLSKEEQDLINKTNQEKRENLVTAQNEAALKNPVTYAPGAAFFGGVAAPYITAGLEGATAALELPAVLGSRTLPYLTANNVLGLAGGVMGGDALYSDLSSGYYGSNAPLMDKMARGIETGLNLFGSPGVTQKLGQSMQAAPKLVKNTYPIESSSSFINNNVTRNLTDLQSAQKFAEQYGYELPANLERISQSDILTDRVIRGMMNRHNTFVRGVSTNWEALEKTNPEIIRHLQGKGFDLSTKEGTKAAAEYMASHIPINTGYGRVSLDSDVLHSGLQGLYTSNSIPTAEGYTYGQGFVTKVKRPTNFSSTNRQDWITQNNPSYRDEDEFRKLMFPLSEESTNIIANARVPAYRKNKTAVIDSVKSKLNQTERNLTALKEGRIKLNEGESIEKSINEHNKLIENLNADIKYLEQHGDKMLMTPEEYKILRTERSNLITDPFDFLLKKPGPDAKNLSQWLKQQPYQEKMKEVNDLGESLGKYNWNDQQPIRAKIKDLENEVKNMYNQSIQDYMKVNHPDYDPVNNYAHYIYIGKPGEKVLEPIKSWEITPEIWKHKSRGHSNVYSKKLSKLEDGGKNNKTINNTNMPCVKLSTGKTVCYGNEPNKYALGGETDDPKKAITLPGVDIKGQSDTKAGGYNYETCVEGNCKGLASKNNLSSLEFRKMNNLFGNARTVFNNAFATPTDLNNLHENDMVVMKKDRLLFPDRRTGYVAGFEEDKTPIIRYFDPKQKRYFTENVSNLGKGLKGNYILSEAYTPDEFRPVGFNTQKLKLDPNYSANDIEKGVIETSQKDAREVQDVLNLTDAEFDQLNKLAFGVIGAESQFGRSGRTLYRMATPRGLQVALKKVKDLFGGIPYDENLNSLSEGYSSTKKSGQYNYGVINPKIKKTQAEINKDIREGKFDNYDKNTNFIYHAFNQLGIDPENLDNAEDSYKAAMAQLAFYKQLNPDATDEDLLKRYTGKRNIKGYKKMVDEHLSKIDGNTANNPEYSAMDQFLGNASIAANNIGRGQRNVKSKLIGAIRDNIPFVPANITTLAADALGSKAPLTNKTFSESNINALKDIVRRNILSGKNSIEYGDYNTTTGDNAESDVGSGNVSLSKGLGDDAYILKTTLGQARIKDLGNGDYEVSDTYDFNDQGRTFGLMDDLHRRKSGLYNLARTIGRNYGSRDGSGAPVSIKLHFTPEELKRTPAPRQLATFDKRSPNTQELTAPNMRGIYEIPESRQATPVANRPQVPNTPVKTSRPNVVTIPNRASEVNDNPNYLGLVDTMKLLGYDNTSKEARKQIASELGIRNYDFSATKNQELKDKLLAVQAIKNLQSESTSEFPTYNMGGKSLNKNNNMPCVKLSSGKTVCYGDTMTAPSFNDGGKSKSNTYIVPQTSMFDPRYMRGYSVSGGELPNQMAARNNAARAAVVVPKRNDVSAFIPNDIPEGEGRMGVGYQPTISELLNLTANDLRYFRDRGLDYVNDNMTQLFDDGNQGMGRNIQERDKQEALEKWYNDRVQEGALYDAGDEGMGRTNYLKDKYGVYALGGETGDDNKKNKGYKYDANGNITHIDVTSVFKDDLDNGKLTDTALNKMRDLQSNQDKIIHFCYSNAGCAQIANMAANAYRGNDWIPSNEFNRGHAWTIGLNNDMEDFFYPYTEDLIRGEKKGGFPNSVVNKAFNPKTLSNNVKNLKNYSDRIILLDRRDVDPNDPESASAQARTGTGNEHAAYMLPDGKFLIHGTSFHNKKDKMKSHFNRNGFFIMDNVQDGRIQGMGAGDYAPMGTVNDD